MKHKKPLSELYQMYIDGNLERKNFEGKIFQYLLQNHERYNVFLGNREKWEEFLSWFYPRLSRAIDLYRDTGSSFDAYITSLVHCGSREYRCREEDHRLTEYTCWKARAEEMELREIEPEYNNRGESITMPKGIKKHHLLFLLLKSYSFVNEEMVDHVARISGMGREVIWFLIDKLRILRSGDDDEIFNLRERVHGQYYRCLAYQKRMESATPGTVYHEKMKGRLERARKKLRKMKKRLCGIRKSATNRMLADVLGIPKGTVDSNLYSIKKHMALTG